MWSGPDGEACASGAATAFRFEMLCEKMEAMRWLAVMVRTTTETPALEVEQNVWRSGCVAARSADIVCMGRWIWRLRLQGLRIALQARRHKPLEMLRSKRQCLGACGAQASLRFGFNFFYINSGRGDRRGDEKTTAYVRWGLNHQFPSRPDCRRDITTLRDLCKQMKNMDQRASVGTKTMEIETEMRNLTP